ncbi:TetR/AcrR family transcriptional regulator [Prescottella equi]
MQQRGRPSSIEPDAIRRTALELFEAKGFAATTMDDVAKASGISRKSLFLYFPSKSDLIWHGSGIGAENLRQALADDTTGDVLCAARAAILSSIIPLSDRALIAQSKLVDNDPTVRELVEMRGLQWRDVVSQYIASETGADWDISATVGYALWRAMWSGVSFWRSAGGDRIAVIAEHLKSVSMRVASLLPQSGETEFQPKDSSAASP